MRAPSCAYETACCWCGAGEPERGLPALRTAVEHGFATAEMLDLDPGIDPLRHLPGFPPLRAQVDG